MAATEARSRSFRWLVAMVRHTTAIFLLGLCTVWHASAAAQRPDTTSDHALSFVLGAGLGTRLDRVVSPSRFSGLGMDAGVRYASDAGPFVMILRANGGTRELHASGSQTSTETAWEADAHVSLLRERDGSRRTARTAFGVDLQLSPVYMRHHYQDPETRSLSYVFGTATLGPAAQLTRSVRGGSIAGDLAIPVLGVVLQPYSAVWSERTPLVMRLAGPASLRGASGALNYELPAHNGVAYLLGYRVGVMRYEDVLQVRGLSQSFTAGVTRHW